MVLKCVRFLKQAQYSPRSVATQLLHCFALKYGFTKTIEVDQVSTFLDQLVEHIDDDTKNDIVNEINEKKAISADLEKQMKMKL